MSGFVVHRRDGRTSLLKTGRELCRLLVKFTPLIRTLYPDATELIAALAAANIACEALEVALKAFETPGV